jgi:hypothetical protein
LIKFTVGGWFESGRLTVRAVVRALVDFAFACAFGFALCAVAFFAVAGFALVVGFFVVVVFFATGFAFAMINSLQNKN